jgi:hypothetical protein
MFQGSDILELPFPNLNLQNKIEGGEVSSPQIMCET